MACIREAYENKYGRSLAKTVEKKFHGKMEDGLLSLLFDPIENFARGLKAAFHGLGTDKVSRGFRVGCGQRAFVIDPKLFLHLLKST